MKDLVRVNFDLQREDHDLFKEAVKASGLDVSKCLRILIKDFIRKEQSFRFADAVIENPKADGQERSA